MDNNFDNIILSDISVKDSLFTNSYRYSTTKQGESDDIAFYVCSGNGELVSDIKIHLCNGTLVYIPAGTEFSYSLKGNIEVITLSFKCFKQLDNTFTGTSLSNKTVKVNTGSKTTSRLLDIYLRQMVRTSEKNLPGSQFVLTSIMYRLLYELHGFSSETCTLPHYEEIRIGIKYIETNYLEDFCVEDVAKLCGVCVSKFHKFFKECTGLTPVDYKNRLKINNALELLKYGEYSIDKISDMLNFCNQSYFIRTFKKFTGFTPRELVSDSRLQKNV